MEDARQYSSYSGVNSQKAVKLQVAAFNIISRCLNNFPERDRCSCREHHYLFVFHLGLTGMLTQLISRACEGELFHIHTSLVFF